MPKTPDSRQHLRGFIITDAGQARRGSVVGGTHVPAFLKELAGEVKLMATKYLPKNMGSLDRLVRAFVLAPAAIIVAFSLGASSIGAIVLFVFAGAVLATSATGRCPTYVPFGIDTHARHARTLVPH